MVGQLSNIRVYEDVTGKWRYQPTFLTRPVSRPTEASRPFDTHQEALVAARNYVDECLTHQGVWVCEVARVAAGE